VRREPISVPLAGNLSAGGPALRGSTFTGSERGKKVLLTGALHGDEVTATGALWRLAELLATEPLGGVVTLLPCVNEPAVRASSRLIPLEGTDLNRQFPGRRGGSLGERVAAALVGLMEGYDALIDVHTAGWCVPFVLLDSVAPDRADFAGTLFRWAAASGLPVIGEMPEELAELQGLDRSWSGWVVSQARKPAFTLELPGFHRLETEAAGQGAQSLLRCLQALAGPPSAAGPSSPTSARREIFANASGLFEVGTAPGQALAEGERIGTIRDLHDGTILESVVAPGSGLLLALQPISAVDVGGWLATVTEPIPGKG
jgi:predicted deacylase